MGICWLLFAFQLPASGSSACTLVIVPDPRQATNPPKIQFSKNNHRRCKYLWKGISGRCFLVSADTTLHCKVKHDRPFGSTKCPAVAGCNPTADPAKLYLSSILPPLAHTSDPSFTTSPTASPSPLPSPSHPPPPALVISTTHPQPHHTRPWYPSDLSSHHPSPIAPHSPHTPGTSLDSSPPHLLSSARARAGSGNRTKTATQNGCENSALVYVKNVPFFQPILRQKSTPFWITFCPPKYPSAMVPKCRVCTRFLY